MGTLFPILLMVVVFYFLLFRPQRKLQRERQALINSLQKHDEVVTRGGILGTIIEVRPEREEVVLEIAKNTRIRLRRAAIEAVIPRKESEQKEEEEKSR